MAAPAPLKVIIRRNLPYADGLAMQQAALEALRRRPEAPETLFCIEHRPAVTLGRTADPAHIRIAPENLSAMGIDCVRVTRGGDVTYHGPGQWTLYPLLRLENFCRDLHRYMHLLEEMVIVYLRGHGINGGRSSVNTGVWVGRNKLAAVGVACSAWISWHGCAVNIQPELTNFTDLLIPCGIDPARGGVTSLAQEAGRKYDMAVELERLLTAFAEVFPYTLTKG